jgi:osmotically-inducible protein OsmY
MEDMAMRTEQDIKKDVAQELLWAPDLDEKDIAVNVTGGVVTLTGFVRSYLQKNAAESAAKRVLGVAALANDIEVRLPASDSEPDPDIARDAIAAIRRELPLYADKIKVLVDRGWITLEGVVEWQFQRENIESSMRHLRGVIGVSNLIAIKPRVAPTEVKRLIGEAFHRNATVDAARITVDADGSTVTLRGKVRSWIEREEAQRTAWSAPGVAAVKNEIAVSP